MFMRREELSNKGIYPFFKTVGDLKEIAPEIDYGVYSDKSLRNEIEGAKGEIGVCNPAFLEEFIKANKRISDSYWRGQKKIENDHTVILLAYAEFLFLWISRDLQNGRIKGRIIRAHLNCQLPFLIQIIKELRYEISTEADKQEDQMPSRAMRRRELEYAETLHQDLLHRQADLTERIEEVRELMDRIFPS